MAAMVLSLCAFAANIETDRRWYLAGEVMTVGITTDNANIAYAELCDVHGMVAGTIVSLSAGKGTGFIEIPSTLHSGYYVLSVYSRDNANVSRKLVAIVNPIVRSEDDDIEWVALKSDSLSYATVFEDETVTAGTLADKKEIGIRENDDHVIVARICNVFEGKTYPRSQITPSLSIIGRQIHYFEGEMVNDTTAVFHTYDLHGKQPLVLSAATGTGVSLPVEMVSPFAQLIPKKLPHLVFCYNRSEVEQRSKQMQLHQMAIAPEKRELKIGEQFDEATENTVASDYDDIILGNKPSLSYNLSEYRQFYTVGETLLEFVNNVLKTRSGGVTQLYVREKDGAVSSWPALVFIDGMPVIDVERLLNYDARRIHYINVYGERYTFGGGVYKGIVSLVSRTGSLTNYPTEPNTQYLVYDFPR